MAFCRGAGGSRQKRQVSVEAVVAMRHGLTVGKIAYAAKGE